MTDSFSRDSDSRRRPAFLAWRWPAGGPGRRQLTRAGLACVVLAAVALLAWSSLPAEAPSFATTIGADRGERKQVTLPDGSILELNGNTLAEVKFYGARREIELQGGEILFTVNAEAQRPFIVRAGSADGRAAGAVFDVRRDEDDVTVLVRAGTADVTGGHWWNLGLAVLRDGHSIRVPASGAIGVPAPADVDALLAWQTGRLVFRDTPMAEVVREMNRYLAAPLRLADSRAGRLRLSASFDLDPPEAMLQALAAAAPVTLAPAADGAIDLKAR
ncbi:FecR family protein [Achromobacter ruhlandii]|uniref:FecR family protein n=1 Tax=Achromobacter ruhlandii TaxID=72557 RepID=UPI0007BEC719|nr:FecR domain-containing protein [Achromobacter ruhlandii]